MHVQQILLSVYVTTFSASTHNEMTSSDTTLQFSRYNGLISINKGDFCIEICKLWHES